MSLSQSKYLMKTPAAATPLAPAEAPPATRTPNEAIMSILRILATEFPDVDFDSRHNAKVLGDYVDSLGVRITLPVLRTGTRLLYNSLELKVPRKETSQESEPEPELKILSDGTRQLSLDITENELNDPSLSKVQIRDWLQRRKQSQ
jgi:hypothetical protein